MTFYYYVEEQMEKPANDNVAFIANKKQLFMGGKKNVDSNQCFETAKLSWHFLTVCFMRVIETFTFMIELIV